MPHHTNRHVSTEYAEDIEGENIGEAEDIRDEFSATMDDFELPPGMRMDCNVCRVPAQFR
jgi:hypothetical protein